MIEPFAILNREREIKDIVEYDDHSVEISLGFGGADLVAPFDAKVTVAEIDNKAVQGFGPLFAKAGEAILLFIIESITEKMITTVVAHTKTGIKRIGSEFEVKAGKTIARIFDTVEVSASLDGKTIDPPDGDKGVFVFDEKNRKDVDVDRKSKNRDAGSSGGGGIGLFGFALVAGGALLLYTSGVSGGKKKK